MSDLDAQLALKARLDRTWSAFFGRHGSFTSVQLAAISPVLDGQNVMLCAPTASGKTEAIVSPLIERHIPADLAASDSIWLLYLVPTKALVNDLWERLKIPLQALKITVGVKTRDLNTVSHGKLPHILISTPESCDSFVTSQAKAFKNLRAIVLDELHLFDGTPRGDQLRVVLNRIRAIRSYAAQHGDAPDEQVQYAALSASVSQPEQTAQRYFSDAEVIAAGTARPIQADLIPLEPDNIDAISDYLASFKAHGWRKALAFCNSRAEVESYAAAVSKGSPFGDAVFVHYSNLECKHRRDIETRFAALPAAICFASSTLELGIDIGSIDTILMIGAPGSGASFVQRAGRGSRRQNKIHIACFYRDPLEQLLFEVFCSSSLIKNISVGFRPSVAIQQIFSLIKQSPTGAIRLAELARLFDGLLDTQDIRAIVGQLTDLYFLQPGRSGEWRAGDRLNRLIDQQANPHQSLSIYSNIKSKEGRKIEIRDQNTQQTLARMDAQWLDRSDLTLEGRAVKIDWYDGEAIWVSTAPEQSTAKQLVYRSARQLLSFELAQQLPLYFGLNAHETPMIQTQTGWLWLHWLGDLYGQALVDLLGEYLPVSKKGIAIEFPQEPPAAVPQWDRHQIELYLRQHYRQLESLLDLGPYQHLLPLQLRHQSVVEQFNIERFQQSLQQMRLFQPDDELKGRLIQYN